MTLEQGWETSLVGGPDLLKIFVRGPDKKKKSFAGHSIFEKFYLKIKKMYIRANV